MARHQCETGFLITQPQCAHVCACVHTCVCTDTRSWRGNLIYSSLNLKLSIITTFSIEKNMYFFKKR